MSGTARKGFFAMSDDDIWGSGMGTMWKGGVALPSPAIDLFRFESQLQHDTVSINDAFAILVSKTRDSMQIGVGVRKLAATLTRSKSNLTEEVCEKVEKAESVSEVFARINHLWSWFHYHLLEDIINDLGDQNDRERLAKYKQKFVEYGKKRVVELPADAFQGDNNDDQVELAVKVDRVWEEFYVKDADRFRNSLASVLGVKKHLLRLIAVRDGCVHLTFLIPRSLAQSAFPLSCSQRNELGEDGVMKLECDEYTCSYTISLTFQIRNVKVVDNQEGSKRDLLQYLFGKPSEITMFDTLGFADGVSDLASPLADLIMLACSSCRTRVSTSQVLQELQDLKQGLWEQELQGLWANVGARAAKVGAKATKVATAKGLYSSSSISEEERLRSIKMSPSTIRAMNECMKRDQTISGFDTGGQPQFHEVLPTITRNMYKLYVVYALTQKFAVSGRADQPHLMERHAADIFYPLQVLEVPKITVSIKVKANQMSSILMWQLLLRQQQKLEGSPKRRHLVNAMKHLVIGRALPKERHDADVSSESPLLKALGLHKIDWYKSAFDPLQQKKDPLTWNHLVGALWSPMVGRADVAAHLKEKHCYRPGYLDNEVQRY